MRRQQSIWRVDNNMGPYIVKLRIRIECGSNTRRENKANLTQLQKLAHKMKIVRTIYIKRQQSIPLTNVGYFNG